MTYFNVFFIHLKPSFLIYFLYKFSANIEKQNLPLKRGASIYLDGPVYVNKLNLSNIFQRCYLSFSLDITIKLTIGSIKMTTIKCTYKFLVIILIIFEQLCKNKISNKSMVKQFSCKSACISFSASKLNVFFFNIFIIYLT